MLYFFFKPQLNITFYALNPFNKMNIIPPRIKIRQTAFLSKELFPSLAYLSSGIFFILRNKIKENDSPVLF